eukprot:3936211-Rhodomonas_salina.1
MAWACPTTFVWTQRHCVGAGPTIKRSVWSRAALTWAACWVVMALPRRRASRWDALSLSLSHTHTHIDLIRPRLLPSAICGGGCNAASLLWLATADPNSEEGVGLSAIADFYCLRDEQQRFCALTMPMDTGNPDYSGGPGGSHSGGSFGWYSGSNGLVFGPDGGRPGG